MIKQLIATAALITVATATANASPTRLYDVRDVSVSYTASDLLNASKVAEIRADILMAAQAACPVDVVQTARSLIETRNCRGEAVTTANAELDTRIALASQLASR